MFLYRQRFITTFNFYRMIHKKLSENASRETETNELEIKKRQKPDAKASDFDVGYTMISEHDGNTYEVKMIEPKEKSSQLTKSYKRWFLNNKQLNKFKEKN